MAKAKLKVGLILDDTLDKPDGVQQYVLGLGDWLTNEGHEVHYLVGQSSRTDVPNVHSLARNVRVMFNGNWLSIPLPAPKKKIRALLAAERFDVLHVQTPHSPFLAQRIIMAAPSSTTIVGTFHIMPDSRLVSVLTRVLGWWLRPSLRRMHQVLAVSPVAKTFVESSFGVSAVVVPNMIDVSRFAVARPFEQYTDMPTIMFLNRLVYRKGCAYLLRAVKYIVSEKLFGGAFRVLVCGKGELADDLRRYVASNNLEHIVTFTGFVSEDDKPRYMASSDIAVFPSTGGESFGIVLAEAMAASKGVVLGGNNPGYASVLSPHPEQLFDPRNTEAFASLLADYLKDAGKRQKAAAWQREHVKQFDIDVVGRKVVAVYRTARVVKN